MTEVLIVEDDETLSRPLARALRREGYDVTIEVDGLRALRHALQETPDLVILDLGLPRLDGLEICQRMRQAGMNRPVMILTARGDETDTVIGLDAGADDYVTKPFRLAELLARVRVLLRRPAVSFPTDDRPIRIDHHARRAFRHGQELSLTVKEFDLLTALNREEGQVVFKHTLMSDVWDVRSKAPFKTLDMHISLLRRKLGENAAEPHHIVTVRGVGFRFHNRPQPL